jgi:hypothetical protein
VSHQPDVDHSVVHVHTPHGTFWKFDTALINIRGFSQCIDEGRVWGLSSVGPFHVSERLPYECWAFVTNNRLYNAFAQLDEELVSQKVTNHMYELYLLDVEKDGITAAWVERLSRQASLVNKLIYPPLTEDFTFIDTRDDNEILVVSDNKISYFDHRRQLLINVSIHMVYCAVFIGYGDILIYLNTLSLCRMRLNSDGNGFEFTSKPLDLTKDTSLGVVSWPYKSMMTLLSANIGRAVTFQGGTVDFGIPVCAVADS